MSIGNGLKNFWKKNYISCFVDICREIFGFLSKLFSEIVKTAINVSIVTLWGRKMIFLWHDLRLLCEKFPRFCWKILQRCCQNCNQFVQQNSLRQSSCFWKSIHFLRNRTMSRKLLTFSHRVFGSVVKSASNISMGKTLWQKRFVVKLCFFYNSPQWIKKLQLFVDGVVKTTSYMSRAIL